jgi:hypothetical protein
MDRRELLKRSAAAGGTLLWVTPTVSVVSGWRHGTSPGPCGDGSSLVVDFYILGIVCGTKHHPTFYLVKIRKDPTGQKPFVIHCGPRITGSVHCWDDDHHHERDDKRSGATKTSDDKLNAMKSSYNWVWDCPDDVQFCTSEGDLVVDLDKNDDGNGCRILFWLVRQGDVCKIGSSWFPGPYDPQVIDEDDPFLLRFLRPNP